MQCRNHWIELNCIVLNWFELNWIKLNWIGFILLYNNKIKNKWKSIKNKIINVHWTNKIVNWALEEDYYWTPKNWGDNSSYVRNNENNSFIETYSIAEKRSKNRCYVNAMSQSLNWLLLKDWNWIELNWIDLNWIDLIWIEWNWIYSASQHNINEKASNNIKIIVHWTNK